MSREIKFRAWIEHQSYMACQGDADLETLQSFIHHYGDQKLMQFTGMKDNIGNEIFEGDLLKVRMKDSEISLEVRSEGCDFVLYQPRFSLYWGKLSKLSDSFECRVVGNIYEK
jgi:uncharacterized phage protein (TIGR01671 family)